MGLLGAGITLASSILGGGGKKDIGVPPEGFQETPGLLKRANSFLGSNVGKAATDIGGGFMSDFRARRNSKNRFQDLQGKGLTPQEIMGGGGGSVSSQGNTLGSGPATQISAQQSFTAGENQKQRMHEKELTAMRTGPAQRQAGVAEGKFRLESEIQPHRIEQIKTQIQQGKEVIHQFKIDRGNFWPAKLATMSPQNVMTALILFNNGLDAQEILTTMGVKPDGPKSHTINTVIQELQKNQGASSQLQGLGETFRKIIEDINELGPNTDDINSLKQFGKDAINPLKGGLLGMAIKKMWKSDK